MQVIISGELQKNTDNTISQNLKQNLVISAKQGKLSNGAKRRKNA